MKEKTYPAGHNWEGLTPSQVNKAYNKEKTLSKKEYINKVAEKLTNDFWNFKKWKKQFIKEILEEIGKKRKQHKKHFDRYNRECIKARSDGDKSQLEYSENQAIKEMNIDDELKEVEQIIKQKAGEELTK